MRKVLSVLLSTTILMGYLTMLAIPAFADVDDNTSATEPAPAPHEHTFSNWTVTLQPTCVAEGKQTASCTCGQTMEETLPPNENNHTWNTGEVITPATCQAAGEMAYTCTSCQQTTTGVIDKLDHRWTAWVPVNATTHKSYCADCLFEEIGDHRHEQVWTADSENHFHSCTACGHQTDVQAHIPGPAASKNAPQLCTVCTYILAPAADHNHEFAAEWTTDEKGHWHSCPQCTEKGEYADHDFENACDPDCTICGYERDVSHDYGEEWVTDEKEHYQECQHCGDIQNKGSHSIGANGKTCDACGYDLEAEEDPTETVQSGTVAPTPKRKPPVPTWAALLIAVVAAALIPVFFHFQRD